jgi:GNAT superfamily N-acetyltransferase
MAELYAKPFETIETGYNPEQPQGGGQQGEMESYLSSLPPEERQAAMERINAPLSGEELALMANSGQKLPTVAEYAEIEKWHKNHEISFIDGLGKIAEGGEQVLNDLSNAFGSFIDKPMDATQKMPATAVEAFAQGTRNFYGMMAQSQNPDSILFKVKDFLNGTGTIEDRYNQYIKALKFNKESSELAEGKRTLVMDSDMINHEITQAMAYIADPTLFIPFGKVASTGLRAVGLGEKLTMAGAKAAAIKNGIIGGTIKWGAGQPLEFLGGAVRNTIDYGLEKAGAAFEATTGMGAKEFAQTARMSGVGFSASAIAGHAVPYASTLSDAYIAGSTARGFGEALTLMGETMSKNKFGRGINSWAAEALEQAEKSGVALSPHAKGLLKALNAVDPLFAYGWNGLEGAAEGAMIGGALGYASGGEEGMYSGIGAGIALGGVGATAGKAVADVTGGTAVARRAVQAKMVIEGHKVTNPDKAMFFQAMQTSAEASGKDVDLVNGIIAGIDKVAPNFEFHAMTPEQFRIEAERKGYNPYTGKFAETTGLNHEFGGDRASKSKAMYILRSVGGDFVGNSKAFLEALKKASAKDSANPNKPAGNIPLALRKYTDVAKTFDKLTKTQQDAILREIDGQADVAKELGGSTKLREHYDALSWSEAWTDSLVKKFETDREGARKDITDMLAQETKKDGKMTKKGRALVDKLRNEGFLDKEGKLLRERNLLQADMTMMEFYSTKGGVMRREADGKTHMYINLNNMGNETFPHELFHTIMRESPMKDHFTKSLIQKLVGSFDAQGNLVRNGEVNINQLRKFFKKYIDLTSFDEDGTMNPVKAEETMKAVEVALGEYEQSGKNKKISDKSRDLLEKYTEEFGAYYFSHWLMGRNRNTLFFGGELKGIEGLVERTKDGFMDFWQSKVSKANPEFDFSKGLNESFNRSGSLGRISSIDYYMRDMVRAASNANREAFRPDSMTLENLRDFERSNGLRNLTTPEGNRRLNPREQVTQNIRLGKEAFKILSGVDKAMRTSKDTIDENGKQVITGRLSETELDALVKGGIVPRAWADKVNQGYAMLDGTVSNVFSAGYLGRTEQTTDASYPRLTGKDVAFKNRKAVLFDVETKVKADGTFYTLFHTLDLAVIEQEANRLFQNTDYRKLFDGDRAVMEADFFRYLSNASKASTDPKKLDSAILLDKGDGLGAQRRDVLHQMGRMALQTGDAYKHQPIAVIPEGFRHSVTTFNIDGMTTPRVDTGTRVDIDMKNAHKFIRENWQPDEMKQEKTPVGRVLTHESGFKFTQDATGRVKAYDNSGIPVGTFGSIKEATTASKNLYNKAQENIRKIAEQAKQKEVESRKNLQPLDEAFYEEAFRIGDMFKTKRMQEIVGNSRLVRQTFDEFLGQKVEEINSGKNEQEKGAILAQLFNSEFKELIELEKEIQKEFEPLTLESRQLQEQEKEIIGKLAEFSQHKKSLQQFSDPDARVDVGILEMFERNYKRKLEVNKRVSEIIQKQHDAGISDSNSHYYITKRLLEKFNETGKLSEEAIKFAITPQLIKAYESNFETGKAVTFLANHGTPNHELMVSKTFNTAFLGRNTGSMSAFNATFFAGSKETSVNYVGTPLSKTWFKDFLEARKYYVKNFSPEIKAKLESMLSSDTSKGVVQKVNYLMKNAHIEFPDDFKLKDTGRKTKEGEPYIAPQPETHLGYDIDGFLDRMLESANDEGAVFGGVEMYWKEAGRQPYLLRNIVKMDNPLVHEYAKADFRDETFASVIQRAKEAGHDGVIFKNTKDGGGLDTIYASFAKNEDGKIFTLETTEDTRFAPRGNDEAGNKVKGGSEIEGRNYQPAEGGAEGGRTYTPEQFKTKFIGRIAAENPELTKNLSIKVLGDKNSFEFYIYDKNSSDTTPIGEISTINKSSNSKDNIITKAYLKPEYRGKGFGKLLYSELGERLRSVGIENIEGTVTDLQNRPFSIRASVFGKDSTSRMSGTQDGVTTRLDPSARYQPSEEDAYIGGRTYDQTGKQFKSGFLGLYAEQNPERVKGVSLQFMKRADGSHRIRLTDNSKKGESADIGHITANISGDTATLSSHINKEYRGRKLAYVVYSEMAERLRAMGVTAVDGTIVNPDGVPVKVREKIIGDTRDMYSGRRINYVEAANRIADKQALVGSMGGVDVTNTLFKQARYQPDEGGRTYTDKQMSSKFIGRIAAENPELTKDLTIKFGDNNIVSSEITSDSPNIALFYNGEYFGGISYSLNKENPSIARIQFSKIDSIMQGEGYGNLMYSELMERFRSMGVRMVTGTIADEKGRPITIRRKVVDEINKKSGFPLTEVKQGNIEETRHVRTFLDSKAWYQPDEGRKYNKGQMDNEFIGRQAAERRDLTNGIRLAYRGWDKQDGKNEGRKSIKLIRTADGNEIGRIDFDYEHLTKYGMKGRGFGETDKDGIIVDGINVQVNEQFQGMGYQHILYSEMFERARAIGATGFSQSIENKKGLPLKSVNRVIGEADNFIASLSETDAQKPTQENFDRLMANAPTPTGDWTSNAPSVQNWGKINKNAWYQPNERIGTQSSNIKLLLEGMASGRILRTSSYKGLGLEDANLIAHTPDTAKIGQVTAGDKALADLQGGIFYAIANGKKIWASNFAGEGETNTLVQFANEQLQNNPNKKTYILLVKPVTGDNSKIFASVDGARGVSNIFKHLNDSKVMTDLRYVEALKESAQMHLKMQSLDGLGKDELYARIDDALLNSKKNGIGFKERANFTREIARQLDEAGAFDSKKSKKALVNSFHKGFERGFSIVEMERVFGNLMAEDVIKDVPAGHVYGALEIKSPLKESQESGHRGYDASIEQESGEPAKLIMFDRTDHVTNIVNRKSGDVIPVYDKEKGSYMSYTGGNIPYQEVKGKSKMPFQPSEFSQFSTEQTAAGRILKNAKGYAIMMVNNKFRVYSPAKALLGVYSDEEQAKSRIYKEIPKQ